jgi:hypothetical protein
LISAIGRAVPSNRRHHSGSRSAFNLRDALADGSILVSRSPAKDDAASEDGFLWERLSSRDAVGRRSLFFKKGFTFGGIAAGRISDTREERRIPEP